MDKYVAIAVFSGVLSAFSQVLLKKSSGIQRDSKIKEYLNPYVISAYGITFICMVLMIIAYKGMPFKYGAVIESLGYLYIMILGRIFFGEKLTAKRVIGNLIIVCGVVVFNF
ncbi:MAG: EamA family transporter [Alphaproteobacteria bacterium]|nr:EamA family transporter [Alphaproteobacteria bacterium]